MTKPNDPLANRLIAIWNWIDHRTGYSDYVVPLMKHIVPRDARWWYVFGSATLTAFIVQVITGVALAMSYVPGGDEAYASLKFISEQAPLGASFAACITMARPPWSHWPSSIWLRSIYTRLTSIRAR